MVLYVHRASRLAEEPEEPQGDAALRWCEWRRTRTFGSLFDATSRQMPQGTDLATPLDSTDADGLSGLSASYFMCFYLASAQIVSEGRPRVVARRPAQPRPADPPATSSADAGCGCHDHPGDHKGSPLRNAG